MDGLVIEARSFEPNDLSRAGPEIEPADVAEIAAVRAAAASGWCLDPGRVGRLRASGGSAWNHVLDDAYVLKSRVAGAGLSREAALCARAAAAGVPVAAPISARTGGLTLCSGGRDWLLSRFVAGSHFGGKPGELAAAAAAFGALSRALADAPGVPEIEFKDVGPAVLDLLGRVPAAVDASASAFIAARTDRIRKACGRSPIISPVVVAHTDFHPLNLLFQNGAVAAVLDFEDVARAPHAVAAGFGAYKLIREQLARTARPERGETARRSLAAWRTVDPTQPEALADGARQRVLANVAAILRAWIVRGDTSINYGLAKQLGSLDEIDAIYSGDFA